MLPCLIFEDDHLLVANKPAGINTHAPAAQAGEGLYDWLRNREPRWASLAIIHRLDKETSGLIVFAKTTLASRSLTAQFTGRTVRKLYVLATDRPFKPREFIAKSHIARAGDRYISSPAGQPAETRFAPFKSPGNSSALRFIAAVPLTGRTHQIRVHAAEHGFPILGDTRYGGTPASRVFLHAAELEVQHPATGERVTFRAPPDFQADARLNLRAALIDPGDTTAYRLIHGAADGQPGWYVDRLGDYLLSQSDAALIDTQASELEALLRLTGGRSAYHRVLPRRAQPGAATEASPQFVLGKTAPETFSVVENGIRFELTFQEGGSTGLFLDQRDNRRRLLTGHIGAGFPLDVPARGRRAEPAEVLNTFAHTCAFSVAAAKAGARTTSLDLSRKYLEWGKRNFSANGLDPAAHDFIFGDAFDWLRRLARRSRSYDVIVLDPPTFSRSRQGAFRAETDYSRLVLAAMPLLRSGGVLLACTNAARWAAPDFLTAVEGGVSGARRAIVQRLYIPQPPDFPVTRSEPAHLKTVWLKIA